MGRLTGKVIVVTGAGRGLGEAAARGFAREGATVGVLDHDEVNVHRVTDGIGGAAFVLLCDVTDEDAVALAFQEVRGRHGRLDVLATYAAIQLIGEDVRAHELPIEVWQRTIDVNLTGVFLSCKYGIGLMLESGDGGSVINCGSPTGLTMCGSPRQSVDVVLRVEGRCHGVDARAGRRVCAGPDPGQWHRPRNR